MLNRTRLSAVTLILLITMTCLSFIVWSAHARAQKNLATANTLEYAAMPASLISLSAVPDTKPAQAALAQGSTENRLETEIITITSTGFDPAEITRPAGQFVLAIHNQSGEAAPALRIDRVRGNKLIEVRMARWRKAIHRQLNPPAGEYVLSIVGHPERNCRITITSN